MLARHAVRRLSVLLMIIVACVSTRALAKDVSEETALARLFRADQIEADWFGPAFLYSFPAETIQSLLRQMEVRHGPFAEVIVSPAGLTVRFERAEVPAAISLDTQGRIISLYFRAAIGFGDLAENAEALADLPGALALLVLEDGQDLIAIEADHPLEVASAGKLAVLAAVSDAIDAGTLAWNEVVQLEEEWRSLPSGILQDWPAGLPITVSALATLAISQSDNTATDALIDLVGRDSVARRYPRMRVFPTTRELFIIAGSGIDDRTEAWLAGTGRRPEELNSLPDINMLPGDFDRESIRAAGWRLSAREICRLLDETAHMPVFAVNPGFANPDDWAAVAYKGGNLPGVLNLSTRLVGHDGRIRCVVATLNTDEDVAVERLFTPYGAILRQLRPD